MKTISNKKFILLIVVLCSGLFFSCGQPKSSQESKARTRVYEGMLPCADCPGIRFTLTIHNQPNTDGGTFSLSQTYLEAENGKDLTFDTTGKYKTLHGVPGNEKAIVWQLVSDKGDDTTNFLCENDSTITMVGNHFQKAESKLNYSLKLVK